MLIPIFRKRYISISLFFLCNLIVVSAPIVFAFPNTSAYGIIRILCEFSSGIVLFELYSSKSFYRILSNFILAISIFLVFFSANMLHGIHATMFAQVPCFCIIILGLAYNNSVFSKILSTKILLLGGYLSYSLYMIHELLLLILRKIVNLSIFNQFPYALSISVIMVFLAAWIIAYIIYFYFESPIRIKMAYLIRKDKT